MCARNPACGSLVKDEIARWTIEHREQRLTDNDERAVASKEMLTELCMDNQRLTHFLRSAHKLCDGHNDLATASLIENWINEAERRTWFLSETTRAV
jgi:starvation-inducible DNA-binding protein